MLGTLDLHCELLSGIRTRDNQHNAMRPRQKKGAPPVAKMDIMDMDDDDANMDIMDMAERRALFPLSQQGRASSTVAVDASLTTDSVLSVRARTILASSVDSPTAVSRVFSARVRHDRGEIVRAPASRSFRREHHLRRHGRLWLRCDSIGGAL